MILEGKYLVLKTMSNAPLQKEKKQDVVEAKNEDMCGSGLNLENFDQVFRHQRVGQTSDTYTLNTYSLFPHISDVD